MKRVFDSEKISGRILTKVLSVIMCVVMLAGTFGLSGCKVINNITNGLNASQKFLSEAELARLMTNAVNSDSNVSDCYANIPDGQLDDLSYSMFSEYCSILRKCAQKHGTADSFKILTENEKQAYFQTIRKTKICVPFISTASLTLLSFVFRKTKPPALRLSDSSSQSAAAIITWRAAT